MKNTEKVGDTKKRKNMSKVKRYRSQIMHLCYMLTLSIEWSSFRFRVDYIKY